MYTHSRQQKTGFEPLTVQHANHYTISLQSLTLKLHSEAKIKCLTTLSPHLRRTFPQSVLLAGPTNKNVSCTKEKSGQQLLLRVTSIPIQINCNSVIQLKL